MIKEIIYPAVFEFDEEGAINITFPDLPSAIREHQSLQK